MVILRTRNKITDFLMILAWASPFNSTTCCFNVYTHTAADEPFEAGILGYYI